MASHSEPVVVREATSSQTGTPSNPSSPTPRNSTSSKTEHEFNEQTNYVPVRRIVMVFLACASVDFVALMDQTTLAASLQIVGDALGAGTQTAWIASGYFITSTTGQLLYGRLSDIWSRKIILLIGLAIFFFGSLASSLAQTTTQLIVFRAWMGIGGGGLMTVAQMIVSDVVPLRERGKYQGILGAVVALANGIGPVVGGALSSQSNNSWRWIFRLNLPLTVLTTGCVIFFMPLKKVNGSWKTKLRAVDFFGIALALAGSSVLMLGLTWGGVKYPWKSTHVIATLVVGCLTCVGFVLWQWKGPRYPLVPLHIFKSKVVNGACITMAINGWNFVVQIYYIPTFYRLVYGYSATKAGALLLSITLTQTLASTLSGMIVHWVGRYRECILFGWVLWAVGLGLMATLDENSGLGKQIGYSLLTGAGVGNTLQPSLVAIQAGVERRDMAVVTSFRNFIRNLGATFGLAISGSLINNILSRSISTLDLSDAEATALLASPSAMMASLPTSEAERIRNVIMPGYRDAFRAIFYVMAGLAALAFITAFFLMPQLDLSRPDDQQLKEEGLSYADAAASGPKQTPEQAAAPQPVELVNNESASTASLVDVDLPSVHTVPSDFLDQEVQTQTQADRIGREQDAKRQAELAKRKAAAKAKKADDWLASYFNGLSDNQASAVVAANLASVVGVSAFLGYKAWGLYQRGSLNGKSVGLGVGILAGVAAVEAFIGPYLYKAKKSDRS